MPRSKGFTRGKKVGRHTTKKETTEAGEPKAPTDPDSTSKQLNPSINLDLGSNVVPHCNEENNDKCASHSKEGKATTIRKLRQKKKESEKIAVESAKDPKIWTKVTVRVHDEVSMLTPHNNVRKEGQSQNKDAEFASPNLAFIEVNSCRSGLSTMSSITASPSLKNISPGLISFRHNVSLLEEFDKSKDEKEEAMNIIKALEELEEKKKEIQESQKRLLDAANNNPHVGELLTSTKRKLADYQSTESLKGMDSLV